MEDMRVCYSTKKICFLVVPKSSFWGVNSSTTKLAVSPTNKNNKITKSNIECVQVPTHMKIVFFSSLTNLSFSIGGVGCLMASIPLTTNGYV